MRLTKKDKRLIMFMLEARIEADFESDTDDELDQMQNIIGKLS